MFLDLIGILISNKEFIAILIAIFPIWQYFDGKKKEQRQIRFENYHNKLIAGLSNIKKGFGLDQQIAIVYELRNYPEYYRITKRLLEGYKERLENDEFSGLLLPSETKSRKRLVDEINLTIDFIKTPFYKKILSYGT